MYRLFTTGFAVAPVTVGDKMVPFFADQIHIFAVKGENTAENLVCAYLTTPPDHAFPLMGADDCKQVCWIFKFAVYFGIIYNAALSC